MQGNEQEGGFKQAMNTSLWLSQVWAYPVEAVIRRPGTGGDRYFSGHAALGLVLLFVFGILASPPHQAVYAFWATSIVAVFLVMHRVKYRSYRKQGIPPPHSRYGAISWFGADDHKAKGRDEPAAVFLAGIVCLAFCQGLGIYLMIAGLFLAVNWSVMKLEYEARCRRMRDSRHEQWMLAEGVKDEWRD